MQEESGTSYIITECVAKKLSKSKATRQNDSVASKEILEAKDWTNPPPWMIVIATG